MDKTKLDKIVEKADTIKRAHERPRLTEDFSRGFYDSVYHWVKEADHTAPDYSVDSRARDSWMRDFVKKEPHLNGVLATSVSLDANRGYSLIGGRNQVIRISSRLNSVENGTGWTRLKRLGALDYYITNVGQVVEQETNGINGPLESLYHVDAARCVLTGDPAFPIKYYPRKGRPQLWKQGTFYRIAGMYNPDEDFHQLGYSPVNIALKLAQIMVAVIDYDLEKLGHLAPKGMLLLESESLTQEQINTAARETSQAYMTETGNRYYQNLMILVDTTLKGNLLELTKMPEKFDPFQFTDYMMKGYALAFGRDVRTYWSMNSGPFGGGAEAALQAERATYAGQADYATSDEEQMRLLMPPTVQFNYDFEDVRGDLLKAQVAKAWTDVGLNLQNLGFSQSQVTNILVSNKVLDQSFIIEDEAIDAAQLRSIRELALESAHVQRAVSHFPDEPIVKYSWPNGSYEVLWDKGSDAIPRSFLFPSWIGRASRKAEKNSKLHDSLVRVLNGEDTTVYDTRYCSELLCAYAEGIYGGETLEMPAALHQQYMIGEVDENIVDDKHKRAFQELVVPLKLEPDLSEQGLRNLVAYGEGNLKVMRRLGTLTKLDGSLFLDNENTCNLHKEILRDKSEWESPVGLRDLLQGCNCKLVTWQDED